MEFIPQAAPFILIDTLLEANDLKTTTQFTIPETHFFVDETLQFQSAGLIENMAQTAAAGTGSKAVAEGAPAPVGFIGQIKNFVAHQLPKVGDQLTTTIEPIQSVMNVQIVKGSVWLADQLIAEAEFKIFLQTNADA